MMHRLLLALVTLTLASTTWGQLFPKPQEVASAASSFFRPAASTVTLVQTTPQLITQPAIISTVLVQQTVSVDRTVVAPVTGVPVLVTITATPSIPSAQLVTTTVISTLTPAPAVTPPLAVVPPPSSAPNPQPATNLALAPNAGLESAAVGTTTASPIDPSRPTSAAAAGLISEPPMMPTEIDPADGGFPGGFPKVLPDVPVTILFLILFISGAVTHISIYRANSKRGHKFLLSDLMFDFCMIRTLTCIFRIIWAFTSPRGVILVALIFENGGAAVIFAVNLFFAQRIFRAMQPTLGWHPIFTRFSLFLIWSVPAVIILNITSIIVSWFSVGNLDQLEATKTALHFGVSWSMMLCVMPLVIIFAAAAIPKKERTETFGKGPLRTKIAVLAYASTTLSVGAALRLTASFNPAAPDTDQVVYSKATFYTTGFLLEILVVVLFAVARIDLLFHVPNGSSKPGDYTVKPDIPVEKGLADMRFDIEDQLGHLGITYEALDSPTQIDGTTEVVIAKLRTTQRVETSAEPVPTSGMSADDSSAEYFPTRPERVSRRATLLEALPGPMRPDRRMSRGTFVTGQRISESSRADYFSEKRT